MAKEEEEDDSYVPEERPEDVQPDAPPSFDINQKYQSNYLKSNYESDDYHELKTMEEDLDKIVVENILILEAFASLRPLKMEDLKPDMEVKIFNEKKAKIVKYLGDNDFKVKLNDGKELKVKLGSIEPSVDPVMKLKKPQLVELYEKCHEALILKNNGRLDIVNFFYVFTEYFRVNERYLLSCLEPKSQAVLLEEIKKRTGMKFSKGINPLFISGR